MSGDRACPYCGSPSRMAPCLYKPPPGFIGADRPCECANYAEGIERDGVVRMNRVAVFSVLALIAGIAFIYFSF